jgi:predicted ATP-dependent endonuclease of OLD family
MALYFDILLENGLGNVIQYFKSHGFEDKIYIDSLPHPNRAFIDKEKFEEWFFQDGFINFLNAISENGINQAAELNDFIKEFFSPIYLIKRQHFLFSNQNKEQIQPIRILRLNEFGSPKRVFSASEDLFGQLVNNSFQNRITAESHIARGFQKRWINSFFGENSELSDIPLNKLCSHFEVKLNNRYLTEHGMGVFKVLNLIYFLSEEYLGNQNYDNVLFNRWTLEEFINYQFDLKQKRPINQNKYLVIEEPETNLHPDFQVILADMLYEFALHSDWHLIVETHSEYLVRKLQVLTANQKTQHDLVRILNFGNKENSGKVKVIKIRKNGGLSDSFFPGFYNVAHELQYQLLLSNGTSNN